MYLVFVTTLTVFYSIGCVKSLVYKSVWHKFLSYLYDYCQKKFCSILGKQNKWAPIQNYVVICMYCRKFKLSLCCFYLLKLIQYALTLFWTFIFILLFINDLFPIIFKIYGWGLIPIINPNSLSFTVGYSLQGWFDTLTMNKNFDKTNLFWIEYAYIPLNFP